MVKPTLERGIKQLQLYIESEFPGQKYPKTKPGTETLFPTNELTFVLKNYLIPTRIETNASFKSEHYCGFLAFIETFCDGFEDCKYFTYVAVLGIIKSFENVVLLDTLMKRCSFLMLNMAPPAERAVFLCIDASNSGSKKMLAPSTYRKAFSEVWTCILKTISIISTVALEVLKDMCVKIIPFHARPVLMFDFLVTCMDTGSLPHKLLCLNSLFVLITDHNLDYPDYYRKIYSLLLVDVPDIMHEEHRSRFFSLMNIIMTSTHLPATLVAAFVKKICRLALSAPPSSAMWAIAFAYNQLRSHGALLALIHRPDSTNEYVVDPFVSEERDPYQCRALESSLWEVEVLKSIHYCPKVCAFSSIFSQKLTKPPYNLDNYSRGTYEIMFAEYSNIDKRNEPYPLSIASKSAFLQ